MVAGYYSLVRQREEAFNAWYCFHCVISFMPDCSEAGHLGNLSEDSFLTLAAEFLCQFKYFIPPSSWLNKEPVVASQVNWTYQLSAHSVNRFLWLGMYVKLMSFFFSAESMFYQFKMIEYFTSGPHFSEVSTIEIKLITEQDCEANG